MCCGLWRGLQRQRQHPFNILVAELARSSWTWFVEQTIAALLNVSLMPFVHSLFGGKKFAGDLRVDLAFTCQQDDARTHVESQRRLWTLAAGLQLVMILRRYFEGYEWASDRTLPTLSDAGHRSYYSNYFRDTTLAT